MTLTATRYKPGRELDALIAEKVMGHPFRKPTHGTCCTCQVCGYNYDDCQCGYSDDIEMAWKIVEKLKEHEFSHWQLCYGDSIYVAWYDIGGQTVWSKAETAPLAICRAALKTVARNLIPEKKVSLT